MDVRMDEPAHLLRAGQALQETEGEQERPAPVVLIEHQGVRDPAAADHAGKGFPHVSVSYGLIEYHLSLSAVKLASSTK